MFLGNPKDSGREDWGTLGKIRGITTPPFKNPIQIGNNPSISGLDLSTNQVLEGLRNAYGNLPLSVAQGEDQIFYAMIFLEKKTPTDPERNIPQTLNYVFMVWKSFHVCILGVPGVCSRGTCWNFLRFGSISVV